MTMSSSAEDAAPSPLGTGLPILESPALDDYNFPIAVIGMSCRFPGEATTPERLWKLCAEGRSAWSEIPSDRFNKDAVYHPWGEKTNSTNVTGGHFLQEDIGLFDATFFNLTPEVAATMDPQCRIQLESAYEAFENAGIPIDKAAGSQTAVFGGSFYQDYMDSILRDPESLPRYVMTGNGSTMISNRLSHFFDLRGPSMTVDTGCSTGLVALHQACQSLKMGDAQMALVAGANIMINPDMFILWSNIGFLSPDGRSYAFDHRAQGYGRGEGVATIILKPLDAAIRDGDTIRAVIRQTALNQDGKTPTLTSPSQAAQEELISLCYKRAGLDPLETAYVEAHGTGTQAGDPIEAGAVANVMGRGREGRPPLYIGSVKTNVGHLETASAFSAIIKTVLAVEKGLIPPSINFERLNAKIKADEWNIKIPQRLEPWPPGTKRRASINNFGYGGANAHVIIEAWEPPSTPVSKTHVLTAPSRDPLSTVDSAAMTDVTEPGEASSSASSCSISMHVQPLPNGLKDGLAPGGRAFVLSARDETACKTMASRLRDYVAESELPDHELLDRLAYTLSERRSRFAWRLAVTASSREELIMALEDASKQTPTRSNEVPRLGFVFTGQGAQWYAMGRELIGVYPVFTDTLREADEYLREMDADWSLLDELTKSEAESRVNDVNMSPPLCIALQIGLIRLLRSWNVEPTGITSHSSGEIAAGYAAGVLTLREALAIVYARGPFLLALQTKAQFKGAMMAAGVGREEAERYIAEADGGKSTGAAAVACVNSPSSVTISGNQDAVARLHARFAAEDIFARMLKIPVAYHSHHMNVVADAYLAALSAVLKTDGARSRLGQLRYTTPVTGQRVVDAAEMTAQHWVNNLVSPVLFLDSLKNMCVDEAGAKQVDSLVEIGAHAALAGPIRQNMQQLPALQDLGITYNSCLTRGQDAVGTVQALAASLVSKGYPVDLDAVNFPHGHRLNKLLPLADLPTYPWNHRTRHWFEPRINKAYRQQRIPRHDLLGSVMLGSSPFNPIWRHFIRAAEVPWVRDHTVQGDIVYPGAGLLSMAIEAMLQFSRGDISGEERSPPAGFTLRDVDIMAALVIPDTTEGVEVQLALGDAGAGGKTLGLQEWREFSIASVRGDGSTWTEHCRGLIRAHDKKKQVEDDVSRREYPTAADPESIFEFFRSKDIYHGPAFKNLQSARTGPGRSVTSIAIADTAALMPAKFQRAHVVHPTTLDSIVVSAYSSLPRLGTEQKSGMVPRFIKEAFVSTDVTSVAGDVLHAHSTLGQHDAGGFHASVIVNGASGSPVIQIKDMFCIAIGGGGAETSQKRSRNDSTCLSVHWVEDLSLASLPALNEQLKTTMPAAELDVIQDLNRACFYFFSNAVNALSATDVKALSPFHVKYYEWMKLQVTTNPHAARWLQASPADWEALVQKVANATVDGEMVCRIGPNIPSIMRQQTAPLELMLRDQLLFRYYQGALHIDRSYAQIRQLLDLFAYKNPKAKILEIGAGTGGCTTGALQTLGGGDSGAAPRFSSYTFTDVSPQFFEQARERFGAWGDRVQYRKLDIEDGDLAGQGFEEGGYDLVIACQVLHATRSMDQTMSNVRRLLKPEGKLMMVETTSDSYDIQLIFGVLPGWWQSEEPERKHSPSLTVDLWDRVLRRTGFTGIEVAAKDCEDEENYVISVLMSTATAVQDSDTDVKFLPAPDEEDVVIVHGRKPPPEAWLAQLRNRIIMPNSKTKPRTVSTTYFESENFNPDDKICIVVDDVETPILLAPSAAGFAAVKRVATRAKGLLWVACGGAVDCENPVAAMHVGFLRTLRCEDLSRRYASVDLEYRAGSNPWTSRAMDAVVDVVGKAFDFHRPASSIDFEYAVRDGKVLISRLLEDREATEALLLGPVAAGGSGSAESQLFFQERHPKRLVASVPGMLDSLVFAEDPDATVPLAPDCVEIEPRAFGLNFRDVMVAMGQLRSETMGFECSGVITRLGADVPADCGLQVGDRVCALIRGHWATRTRTHWTSVARMPETLTFEIGASVPVVYATAYYGLHTLAGLSAGEKILIHSAAGGAGQAAVMLAQTLGAEVFCTVGSPEKVRLLVDEYGIPETHIFNSRGSGFGEAIMRATGGKGVDVVLNSLAGELLHETWTCLAPFGRFVEIGKRDLEQNSSLQMAPFASSASFFAIDIAMLGQHRHDVTRRVMQGVMDLFQDGRVRPMTPITTYPISQLEKAFRTMQSGKHLGKIVIVPGVEDKVPTLKRGLKLSSNASYLVVGGLGGLGKSITRRLVERGAKNLVLLSRSAESTKNDAFVAELSSLGVRCERRNVDLSNAAALAKTCKQLEKVMPPVRGVIQGAMVLQDSIVENMTQQDYNAAVRPKVHATANLDRLFSRPGQLDYFVMLSSLVGVAGHSSQANYGAGGAFEDAVARNRTARGLPGVALDLGMIGSVGYVAENAGVEERLARQGWNLIPEEHMLRLVEGAMATGQRATPSESQVVVGIAKYRDPGQSIRDDAVVEMDPRFACLSFDGGETASSAGQDRSDGSSLRDLAAPIRGAESWDAAVGVVCGAIVSKLSSMFALSEDEINPDANMAHYGVDSLVAVELRNWLSAAAQCDASVFDIMQSKSLMLLASTVCMKSRLVAASLKPV